MYMVSFDDGGVSFSVKCADYFAVLLLVKDLPSDVPYKIFKEVKE